MTFKEANDIFENWREYIEINDKLTKIFTSIPESFLPYPIDILEEALNIVAEYYFNKGNYKMSKNIQEIMATLMCYKDDDEAVNDILDSFVLKDPELRKLHIKNLKEARDSWANLKKP